jgi:hypothetical protein
VTDATHFRVQPLTILFVIAALILVAIGVVYFVTPAESLPSFVPGHASHDTTHHLKHGLAAIGLALACLVGAWFTTRPNDTPSQNT